MTIAGFFSMVASYVAQMAYVERMFGGGDRRDGGTPVYLIVMVVWILTYVISYILILSLSRYREFAADRGAALITGAPENLMSALQKIASNMTRIPQRDLREMQGMNAFYIVPTNLKSPPGSSSSRTRRSRSGSSGSLPSPPRWGARSRSSPLAPGRSSGLGIIGARDLALCITRSSRPGRRLGLGGG